MFLCLTGKTVYSGENSLQNYDKSFTEYTFQRNVVLLPDKDTDCSTNLPASGIQEYDVITVTCSITYSGKWVPVMRWFNSIKRHNFTDDDITLTTNETTVTSELMIEASADLNGSMIACVTSFDQPSTSLQGNAATNVPSYTYTWTSPILNVALRCK